MLRTILEGNNRGKKARVIKWLSREIFNDSKNITNIANWSIASPCKDSTGITVEYYIEFNNFGYMSVRIYESYEGDLKIKYQDVWTNEFVSQQELYKRHKEEYIPKGYSYESELEEISQWK